MKHGGGFLNAKAIFWVRVNNLFIKILDESFLMYLY